MHTFVDLGAPLLNDKLVEAQFLGSTLQHPLFDRVLGRYNQRLCAAYTIPALTSVMSRNTNTCFV